MSPDPAPAPAKAIPLADDGTIPNSQLPLLLYRGALSPHGGDLARGFQVLFAGNGWGRSWRDGIYPFRHYHSTAHEVLGIAAGTVRLELGGPRGVVLGVAAGDALLIPAGVSHRNLGASGELLVIGAYPAGPACDLCRDTARDRAAALRNLPQVARPRRDPVCGTGGGLVEIWPRAAAGLSPAPVPAG